MNKMSSFSYLAGWLAILAGLSGFLYSLSFIVIARNSPALGGTLSAFFLLLGALLSSGALIGLYQRLEATEAGFALWALILGVGATLGSAAHGAYDLANAFNVPGTNPISDLPSQVDPRGFFTFGVAGAALLVFALLLSRSTTYSRNFTLLTFLLGVLLIVIYVGRLIILDATNLVIVIPAVATGFIINPLWYIWLGLQLRRG